MVLTGISSKADLESWSPQPDLVIDIVSDLFAEV
jgi:ribonucleotide monophosphatase NagD (HAD superfamily)